MGRMTVSRGWTVLGAVWCLLSVPAAAQLDFERDPVNYSRSEPTDPVARLQSELGTGTQTLSWDDEHGYLKSLLAALQIEPTSQTLVFSKTSLQVGRISPDTPRAIYFNDDVYVGWIPRADSLEISAADPRLGGTFYTLRQDPNGRPKIRRETARCLSCHASSHTRRVPGHMVRSVYPSANGLPVYRLGTYINDDRSPFAERWGGWYVSGTHGRQRHMGNGQLPQSARDAQDDDSLDSTAARDLLATGANVTDLSTLFDTSRYLTPHSDLVALMVLQHQTAVHNALTAASHSGQLTARDAKLMNEMLEREPDYESESTVSRYEHAAERLVRVLLGCDAEPLTDPVRGTTSFASDFAARGPTDSQGRSLRQLDLQTRLLRYPCSFLVYSDSFTALPCGVKRRVLTELHTVLTAASPPSDFEHLTDDDRHAIHGILRETLSGYPPALADAVPAVVGEAAGS